MTQSLTSSTTRFDCGEAGFDPKKQAPMDDCMSAISQIPLNSDEKLWEGSDFPMRVRWATCTLDITVDSTGSDFTSMLAIRLAAEQIGIVCPNYGIYRTEAQESGYEVLGPTVSGIATHFGRNGHMTLTLGDPDFPPEILGAGKKNVTVPGKTATF